MSAAINRQSDIIEQRLESEFRDIGVVIHPEPKHEGMDEQV